PRGDDRTGHALHGGSRAALRPGRADRPGSVSIAAVFAIGLWVSAIARPRTAGMLAAGCFFPLMFFAGLFLPHAEMPKALLDVSNLTPLGAAVQAIQSSLLNGFPPLEPLVVLTASAIL